MAFLEVPHNGHDMPEEDRMRWHPEVDMGLYDDSDIIAGERHRWGRKGNDEEF